MVGGGALDVKAKQEARRRKVERVALPAGMVLVQVFTVLTMLVSKVALNAGMHPLVLLVYRNLVAAAAVAPPALVFERYYLPVTSRSITHVYVIDGSPSCIHKIYHPYIIISLNILRIDFCSRGARHVNRRDKIKICVSSRRRRMVAASGHVAAAA